MRSTYRMGGRRFLLFAMGLLLAMLMAGCSVNRIVRVSE